MFQKSLNNYIYWVFKWFFWHSFWEKLEFSKSYFLTAQFFFWLIDNLRISKPSESSSIIEISIIAKYQTFIQDIPYMFKGMQ